MYLPRSTRPRETNALRRVYCSPLPLNKANVSDQTCSIILAWEGLASVVVCWTPWCSGTKLPKNLEIFQVFPLSFEDWNTTDRHWKKTAGHFSHSFRGKVTPIFQIYPNLKDFKYHSEWLVLFSGKDSLLCHSFSLLYIFSTGMWSWMNWFTDCWALKVVQEEFAGCMVIVWFSVRMVWLFHFLLNDTCLFLKFCFVAGWMEMILS